MNYLYETTRSTPRKSKTYRFYYKGHVVRITGKQTWQGYRWMCHVKFVIPFGVGWLDVITDPIYRSSVEVECESRRHIDGVFELDRTSALYNGCVSASLVRYEEGLRKGRYPRARRADYSSLYTKEGNS